MNDFKRSTLGERTCFLRRKKRSESAFSLGGYNSEIGEKAALQDSDLLEMCGKRKMRTALLGLCYQEAGRAVLYSSGLAGTQSIPTMFWQNALRMTAIWARLVVPLGISLPPEPPSSSAPTAHCRAGRA